MASMTVVPFEPDRSGAVLVVGAGGGCDVVCGLPVALELEERGYDVHLANYSFTDLSALDGIGRPAVSSAGPLVEVSADSSSTGDYFPEGALARWYRERRGTERSVWCFGSQGVQPLLAAYDYLCERLGVATVVCVDGGVDGIFRGDEHDLGTPSMDSISVMATSLCRAPHRLYCCTAFGTEGAEGTVSHGQALQRMAELARRRAGRGVGQVLGHDAVGRAFVDGAEYVFAAMPAVQRSIVVSTMLAAMDGRFGRVAVTAKTVERPPWISPLQTLFWYFDAFAVAKMKLFYDEALSSVTVADVVEAVERVRQRYGVEKYLSIPI